MGNTSTMTRLGTAAVALALLGALATGASGSNAAPTVRARSLAPLTVGGANFRPAESVRVTLESPVHHSVRVHARPNGSFVAVFRGVAVERCDGFLVRAAGSKGSTAMLRSPRLMCASTNPG
jgi:hypothetical protein